MIPHHASIVALAQAGLPQLQDGRLREIARTIGDTQAAEFEELRGYRERFYGDPAPMPLDERMMGEMEQTMPGMPVPMDEMMAQMDAAMQVALVCAAADTDRAFIDLTIPHHESAIAMAEAALDEAAHEEVRAFAERIIADHRREIAELGTIRAELSGSATPEAGGSPAAGGHGGPVVDHFGLVDALRAAGFTVDAAGALTPDVPFGGAQAGTVLRLRGGGLTAPGDVQSYEYADPAAAAADAGQILPDGNTRTAMIGWVGPPHFFRAGRLVVLYVGTDAALVDALTALLGPPFAGQ